MSRNAIHKILTVILCGFDVNDLIQKYFLTPLQFFKDGPKHRFSSNILSVHLFCEMFLIVVMA